MAAAWTAALALLVAAELAARYVAAASGAPVVNTTCGALQGVQDGAVLAFLGIPYAAPPEGALRWQPPAPAACWNGTRPATRFSSSCAQGGGANGSALEGAEDCLYLNVWIPAQPKAASLPVFFFIHGGDLTSGSGADALNLPVKLVADGGRAVAVSINYRLNAFGFLCLDLLSAASPDGRSGNYGLLDQIAALEWVQQNIAAFGGDPMRVTIAGQSSGGTSVIALTASPLAKGLFRAAVSMSGSYVFPRTLTQASQDNLAWLKASGCATLDCIYALSAEQVLAAIPLDSYPDWGQDFLSDFPVPGRIQGALPVIDGTVLPQDPFSALASGAGDGVTLVLGTMSEENDMGPYYDLTNWTATDFARLVRQRLTLWGGIGEQALQLYADVMDTPQLCYDQMTSDAGVGCGNSLLARSAAAAQSSPVYRYVFSTRPAAPVCFASWPPFCMRYAFHTLDMTLAFDTAAFYPYEPRPADLAAGAAFRQLLLQLLEEGSFPPSLWPSAAQATALINGTTLSLVDDYHAAACALWFESGMFLYGWSN